MLSRGNFYAEKHHSNKVLLFGARGSGNYASPCMFVCILFRAVERLIFLIALIARLIILIAR